MLTKNVADVALAAMITAEGMVSRKGALLESVATVLLESALGRVRVQAMLVFEATVEGVHWRAGTVTGPTATSERVVDTEEPLKLAVTMAVWSERSTPVVALKVAAVAPAATGTEAGTVRVGLLLDRLTLAPPVGAALVRMTVQVLAALGPRVVEAQNSEETRTGDTRDTLAEMELPLNDAVSVAV